jgi:hypothetical protein
MRHICVGLAHIWRIMPCGRRGAVRETAAATMIALCAEDLATIRRIGPPARRPRAVRGCLAPSARRQALRGRERTQRRSSNRPDPAATSIEMPNEPKRRRNSHDCDTQGDWEPSPRRAHAARTLPRPSTNHRDPQLTVIGSGLRAQAKRSSSEKPNEPEGRNPNGSRGARTWTRPDAPMVAAHSPLPCEGVVGTDSHGRMDQPKGRLRHHG